LDKILILAAANKSLSSTKFKTANIHSELLYNLSPSKNIGEAYRTVGVKPDSKYVTIALFNPSQEDIQFVKDFVKGVLLTDDEEKFEQICDKEKICKAFNITSEEFKLDLVANILSRMAVRDI
jgi:EKC/KEOPS complex subunit CGI121/TPRKB